MQSIQPRTFYPKSGISIGDLEGAIWKAYLNCIDACQAFQMESGQAGSAKWSEMASLTFPSKERFADNVDILEGILTGVGLVDEEYKGRTSPGIRQRKVKRRVRGKECPFDYEYQMVDEDYDFTPTTKDRWIEINSLMKRQNCFREKPVIGIE